MTVNDIRWSVQQKTERQHLLIYQKSAKNLNVTLLVFFWDTILINIVTVEDTILSIQSQLFTAILRNAVVNDCSRDINMSLN